MPRRRIEKPDKRTLRKREERSTVHYYLDEFARDLYKVATEKKKKYLDQHNENPFLGLLSDAELELGSRDDRLSFIDYWRPRDHEGAILLFNTEPSFVFYKISLSWHRRMPETEKGFYFAAAKITPPTKLLFLRFDLNYRLTLCHRHLNFVPPQDYGCLTGGTAFFPWFEYYNWMGNLHGKLQGMTSRYGREFTTTVRGLIYMSWGINQPEELKVHMTTTRGGCRIMVQNMG
jgi:hypothetical protein